MYISTSSRSTVCCLNCLPWSFLWNEVPMVAIRVFLILGSYAQDTQIFVMKKTEARSKTFLCNWFIWRVCMIFRLRQRNFATMFTEFWGFLALSGFRELERVKSQSLCINRPMGPFPRSTLSKTAPNLWRPSHLAAFSCRLVHLVSPILSIVSPLLQGFPHCIKKPSRQVLMAHSSFIHVKLFGTTFSHRK